MKANFLFLVLFQIVLLQSVSSQDIFSHLPLSNENPNEKTAVENNDISFHQKNDDVSAENLQQQALELQRKNEAIQEAAAFAERKIIAEREIFMAREENEARIEAAAKKEKEDEEARLEAVALANREREEESRLTEIVKKEEEVRLAASAEEKKRNEETRVQAKAKEEEEERIRVVVAEVRAKRIEQERVKALAKEQEGLENTAEILKKEEEKRELAIARGKEEEREKEKREKEEREKEERGKEEREKEEREKGEIEQEALLMKIKEDGSLAERKGQVEREELAERETAAQREAEVQREIDDTAQRTVERDSQDDQAKVQRAQQDTISEIDNDDSYEDESMREMMQQQQQELEAHREEIERIKNDQTEATEAERAAKVKEAEEALQDLKEKREAAVKKSKKAKEDKWVGKSRPGAEAKPGAKLSQTAAAASKESVSDRNRDRVPESLRSGSGGGAKGNYFGGQSAASKEADAKKKEALRKANETGKMSSGAGDRRREIEAKLSPQMREKAAAESMKKAEEEREHAARTERASFPRSLARPIEKILNTYNNQNTDLYDVLGVGKGSDEVTLKKAYRKAALKVHPDKNKHPDSKIAFDAIQEAFETLSSPTKRNSYDKELRKRYGRPTLKKLLWNIKGEFQNMKSRFLLFRARVFQRGEAEVEYQELIGNRIDAIRTAIARVAEHFVLLPSVVDRVRLVSEISFDSGYKLLLGALLMSVM